MFNNKNVYENKNVFIVYENKNVYLLLEEK